MTPEALRIRLALLGLSQSAFVREIERLGGEPLGLRTVQHWLAGDRVIPPTVPAILTLLEALRAKTSA